MLFLHLAVKSLRCREVGDEEHSPLCGAPLDFSLLCLAQMFAKSVCRRIFLYSGLAELKLSCTLLIYSAVSL